MGYAILSSMPDDIQRTEETSEIVKFSYKAGDVTLGISVRRDDEQAKRNLHSILTRAAQDVEALITPN